METAQTAKASSSTVPADAVPPVLHVDPPQVCVYTSIFCLRSYRLTLSSPSRSLTWVSPLGKSRWPLKRLPPRSPVTTISASRPAPPSEAPTSAPLIWTQLSSCSYCCCVGYFATRMSVRIRQSLIRKGTSAAYYTVYSLTHWGQRRLGCPNLRFDALIPT